MLKYWPFANYGKETYFLQELQEVLDVCDVMKLEPRIERLFKQIVKCLASSHVHVTDRTMCFFENDFFLNLLGQYKQRIFPMIVPVVITLAEKHWHEMMQDSFRAIINIMKNIDEKAFDNAAKNAKSSKL